MLPAFRTLLRQKIAEFLSDDAFLDNYFESLTGALRSYNQGARAWKAECTKGFSIKFQNILGINT